MSTISPEVRRYLDSVSEDRQAIFTELYHTIDRALPEGFHSCINYKMPGWVVPHSLYPPGYHVTPKLPLPFINIASQKSHIGLYHMGIYANPELLSWFQEEYTKHSSVKLNMGKSCIRFKKPHHVPLKLIEMLCTKMTPQDWIDCYEAQIKR